MNKWITGYNVWTGDDCLLCKFEIEIQVEIISDFDLCNNHSYK